jgi:hypothetical protein
MVQTLGMLLIVCGAGGLVLIGLYGLAPGLIAVRPWKRAAPVRLQQKRLLAVADLTPKAAQTPPLPLKAPPSPVVAPNLAADIFAELFSLRAGVAGMTRELKTIRRQLESAGVLPTEEEISPHPSPLTRAA